jgi:hypothetical protein
MVDKEPTSRATIIGVVGPVRIREGTQEARCRPSELQAIANGELEVAQDSLDSPPVEISGTLHKLNDMIHNKRYV